MYIEHDGRKINYEVRRSKRRTVGISVDFDRGVIIAVPSNMRNAEIQAIVRKKSKWIINAVDKVEKQAGHLPQRKYNDGETFFYLGNEYNLKTICPYKLPEKVVHLQDHCIIVNIFTELPEQEKKHYIKNSLVTWYKECAKEVVNDRISLYILHMGVAPANIRIKDQKTRWGSCSSKKNVNINWKIVMAPINIIDYIIVHELAHLKEMNHSQRFWSIVESVLPDYRERKEWLKENTHRLTIV